VGYNAANSGDFLPTFRDNLTFPSSSAKKSKIMFVLEWESNYWLILKKQVLLIRRDAAATGSSLVASPLEQDTAASGSMGSVEMLIDFSSCVFVRKHVAVCQ